MPTTRNLVSGRDFQLRYALHRVTLLALRIDPLHERVARIRLEWPVAAADGKMIDVDVALHDDDDAIVEIVECREHLTHLPLDSAVSFLDNVARLRTDPQRRFRFATPARFLDDGTDFAKPPARARALREAKNGSLHSVVTWELRVARKELLTAEAVFYFGDFVADPRGFYSRLYARLAGQMSHRLQAEGDVCMENIRDLHQSLFGDIDDARLSGDLSIDAEDSFSVDELRRTLQRDRSPRTRARASSSTALASALGRGMFEESSITLEDVFIEPDATAIVESGPSNLTTFTEPALSLLFEWVRTSRQNADAGGARVVGFKGTQLPLLVLGPFGFGKTSLLMIFAKRLLDSGAVTPLFVALRNLKEAGTEVPLIDALARYVRDAYGIDICTTEEEICLFCDGFDELNLFYTTDETQRWVENGYRQLSALARRPNVSVIISSRPILLMDSAAVKRDGATHLALLPFDDDRIDDWCHRYAGAAGLGSGFSLEFLEERNLVEVARTPIVLYMIARIVETQPELLEARRYTRAEIYRLFITWTERGGYHKDAPKHELPSNYRHILQDIAWQLFQSGKGFMREKEVLDALRVTYGATTPERIPVGRNLLVAHMFTSTPGTGAQPAGESIIEFTHQSFREYLVAERIWRLLEPARHGQPLDAATWFFLGGRLLTDAKVQLLVEMAQELGPEEAGALYAALSDTDNVHSYWSKWSRPVWDLVRSGEMPLERARTMFDTLAIRAAGLAVLSTILKIKCFRRMGRDGDSVHGDTLRRLLSFLDTFPDLGNGIAARALLEANFAGLRLTGPTDLSLILLANPVFADCVIHNIYFDHARLASITLQDSVFVNCRFRGTQMNMRWWHNVKFENCDFTGAELELLTDDLCEGVELRNCDFSRASLGSGALADVLITDCTWTDARAGEFQIIRGTIDEAAKAFVDEHNVHLVDVTVVASGAKRRPARRPATRRR